MCWNSQYIYLSFIYMKCADGYLCGKFMMNRLSSHWLLMMCCYSGQLLWVHSVMKLLTIQHNFNGKSISPMWLLVLSGLVFFPTHSILHIWIWFMCLNILQLPFDVNMKLQELNITSFIQVIVCALVAVPKTYDAFHFGFRQRIQKLILHWIEENSIQVRAKVDP